MFLRADNINVFCYSGINLPDSNQNSLISGEIFFALTKDLISEFSAMSKYISDSDKSRADKFHFDDDRDTWLLCHTLLRIVIAEKLNIDPANLLIIKDKNNKPLIKGDPLFFSISHTRDAFCFVISDRFRVGIDLEKVNRNIDFESIAETFFSRDEREFIMGSSTGSRERFFLLWTRKEALLKAIGTGIIPNLQGIEVFRDINVIPKDIFEGLADNFGLCDYYINSDEIYDYYLSAAATHKIILQMHYLDAEAIKSYLRTLSY
jgi:4'-phosphopantetheinyl transferase